MRLHRLYRYVGPADIATAARSRAGTRVRTTSELTAAYQRLDGRRDSLVCTYVVDAVGDLRIADRASEHVDCASGGPVMAAGELTLERDGSVSEITNLSTGFCPEVTSWPAVSHAFASVERAPSTWSYAFEFRRCGCGARVVLKDDDACPECDATLATTWNFERVSVRRGVWGEAPLGLAQWRGSLPKTPRHKHVELRGAKWRVDTIEEPAERDEDRVLALFDEAADDPGALFVVADGVGGTGGGRAMADALVDAFARERPRTVPAMHACVAALRAPGQAAFVAARLRANGSVVGIARGDTLLIACARGEWRELTEGQPRSHDARPAPFALAGCEALFACSDGLWKYVDRSVLEAMLDSDDAELPWRLVDAVRMRSGGLHDDVSAIFARRV